MPKSNLFFLIYFIPLFCAKIVNWTADDSRLVLIAFISFIFWLIKAMNDNYSKKELIFWIAMGVYGSLLVATCGKEGVLFSIMTLFSMHDINIKKLLKFSVFIGIIMVCISMYIERAGEQLLRYTGGDWELVYKRSNILYISFFAIVSLVCILKKNKLTYRNLVLIAISSYFMYKYTGSRTGAICAFLLIIIILILKNKRIRHLKLVKTLCIISPIICALATYLMSYLYGKYDIFYTLNDLLQGRLKLGNSFLNSYSIKIFGQQLIENDSVNDFKVLDAAYLDMLLAYGLLFICLWLAISCLVIRYLYLQDRYIEIAVIISYAIYGISETFLPNCFLNVSILIYGEYINHCIKSNKYQELIQYG